LPLYADNEIQGYWNWAGIEPPKNISSNTDLYIYQGVIRVKGQKGTFNRKGLYPFPINASNIYLVYRIEGGLPDPVKLKHLLKANAQDWQKHNVAIKGIQLDFDSPTSKLLQYSKFLNNLRKELPSNYKLSITGLGDWIISGDPKVLTEITQNIDEIIFQLYQGRSVFSNIDLYVNNLVKLNIPFKIGLLDKYPYKKTLVKLKENNNYKGLVLFIQR
jgi:hypothetical protein